ncbi:MAG: hypothetical protein AB7I41_11235 [Candidatus Sericytochromatia bacterium]
MRVKVSEEQRRSIHELLFLLNLDQKDLAELIGIKSPVMSRFLNYAGVGMRANNWLKMIQGLEDRIQFLLAQNQMETFHTDRARDLLGILKNTEKSEDIAPSVNKPLIREANVSSSMAMSVSEVKQRQIPDWARNWPVSSPDNFWQWVLELGLEVLQADLEDFIPIHALHPSSGSIVLLKSKSVESIALSALRPQLDNWKKQKTDIFWCLEYLEKEKMHIHAEFGYIIKGTLRAYAEPFENFILIVKQNQHMELYRWFPTVMMLHSVTLSQDSLALFQTYLDQLKPPPTLVQIASEVKKSGVIIYHPQLQTHKSLLVEVPQAQIARAVSNRRNTTGNNSPEQNKITVKVPVAEYGEHTWHLEIELQAMITTPQYKIEASVICDKQGQKSESNHFENFQLHGVSIPANALSVEYDAGVPGLLEGKYLLDLDSAFEQVRLDISGQTSVLSETATQKLPKQEVNVQLLLMQRADEISLLQIPSI